MEKLSEINQNQLMNYVLSHQTHPVPLQSFWELCGYPDFQEAKQTLIQHFQVDQDFIVSSDDTFPDFKKYSLTLDCAKCMAAMNFKNGNRVKQFLMTMQDQLTTLPQVYRNSIQALQTKLEELSQRLWDLEKNAINQNLSWHNELDQMICSYASQKDMPALQVYQTLLLIARENVDLEQRGLLG